MQTKTVFIESAVGNKRSTSTRYVKTGNKKPLFGGLIFVDERKRVVEQGSDGRPQIGIVNGEDLAEKISTKTKELLDHGFEVFSITPILNGVSSDKGWGKTSRSSGFSYTAGVLLHCKKKEP